MLIISLHLEFTIVEQIIKTGSRAGMMIWEHSPIPFIAPVFACVELITISANNRHNAIVIGIYFFILNIYVVAKIKDLH